MTWSYGGNPTSSKKDEVRYLVGDTTTTDQQLSDEEISYHLLQNSNNALEAAIDAADALMAKYAREVTRESGDLRIEAEKRMGHYKALHSQLKAKRSKAGSNGIFIGNDPNQRLFSIGMMDRDRDVSYDGPS